MRSTSDTRTLYVIKLHRFESLDHLCAKIDQTKNI